MMLESSQTEEKRTTKKEKKSSKESKKVRKKGEPLDRLSGKTVVSGTAAHALGEVDS